MKKIALILGLFLVLNSNTFAKTDNNAQIHVSTKIGEQKFVNPIFYQPLRPLGRTSTLTYITPTSIEGRTPLDDNLVALTGKCKLLENKQNFVKLICDIKLNALEKWDFPIFYKDKIYTYKLKELLSKTCLIVEKKDYNLNEDDAVAITHYCVTPPDKPLKSD